MLLSLITAVALYAVTFFVHGGFAHSITFNGGIRFSLLVPPGLGKQDIEKGLAKSGLGEAQVRLANLKANQFDVEFGPGIQTIIKKKLEAAPKENKPEAKPGKKEPQEAKKQEAKKPEAKKPEAKKQEAKKQEAKKQEAKKQEAKKQEAKKQEAKKQEKDAQTAGKLDKKTVIGEIERMLLESLPMIRAEGIVSREAISASYGGNLAVIAVWSLIVVIGVIGLYLSFRFEFPFAIGASLALVHDVILTVGFIGIMKIEPSIPVVAAVLTIIGYSINDTIVIFDRIRDQLAERKGGVMETTMDLAITQTLSRTIITSLSTLITVFALLTGGATSLFDFAQVLLFGILVGTYSSIFIASHFVQYYEKFREKFLLK